MKHIVVVEDDDQFRSMLRELLSRAGYAVTEARNGREALAACRAEVTDLVITDILMPETEGIETIRELRRERPGLPIIATSGGGRVGPLTYLALARRAGADRTFEKPFSTREMLDAVRELTTAEPGAAPA